MFLGLCKKIFLFNDTLSLIFFEEKLELKLESDLLNINILIIFNDLITYDVVYRQGLKIS